MIDAGTCLARVWLESHVQSVPGDAESVRMLVRGPNTLGTTAVVRRAAVGSTLPAGHGRTLVDEHLVAGPDETDHRWLSAADAIVIRADDGPGGVARPLASMYSRFPGCLVTALVHPGSMCVVETITGWRIQFVPWWAGACADGDASSYASLVHAWMVTSRPFAALNAAHIVLWDGRSVSPYVAWVNAGSRPRGRAVPD